eukprot:gnl/TRDRNA2_/TRDRNA2_129769_c0_seq1.p1 gnl/TRDRNA2_/TRDRNA2_129769_c0~~gnl/TRDRNA2_/TRDRNA2_129769_c0_seq1.p1  ORF type:complete len:223 (-),score=33.16 gnl/TRDRNA2_/TRDRNA2_129769_c0_seq1:100-768(-)
MCGCRRAHHSNACYLAASIVGTLAIYTARYAAAGDHNQHLHWRCPVPFSGALFACGQLSGVALCMISVKGVSFSVEVRRTARMVSLILYLLVSVTSTFMLGFLLLWAAGFPRPRCLSGSTWCLRLRANLEQTGWITIALSILFVFQLMGAVAAAHMLYYPDVENGPKVGIVNEAAAEAEAAKVAAKVAEGATAAEGEFGVEEKAEAKRAGEAEQPAEDMVGE